MDFYKHFHIFWKSFQKSLLKMDLQNTMCTRCSAHTGVDSWALRSARSHLSWHRGRVAADRSRACRRRAPRRPGRHPEHPLTTQTQWSGQREQRWPMVAVPRTPASGGACRRCACRFRPRHSERRCSRASGTRWGAHAREKRARDGAEGLDPLRSALW
jgi:hypothetical protein